MSLKHETKASSYTGFNLKQKICSICRKYLMVGMDPLGMILSELVVLASLAREAELSRCMLAILLLPHSKE